MQVRISAKRAMFTNPIFRTERITYPVPTPGAIVGCLHSIYAKPEMEYEILSIKVLKRPRFESEMSRFVTSKDNPTDKTIRDVTSVPRSEMCLRDVDYLVNFSIHLTGKGDPKNDNLNKHYEMLRRRLEKGQYFLPPFLGTKECLCDVELAEDEDVESELKGEYPLPIMLHHVPVDPLTRKPTTEAVYYHPKMYDGFIDCTDVTTEIGNLEEGDFLKNLYNFYLMYGEELMMPKDGYQVGKITYKLTISQTGEPLAFEPLQVNAKGKPVSTAMMVPLGAAKSSNISANFLWAEGDYVFGMDAKRGEAKLDAFIKKIQDIAADEPPEALCSILDFYSNIADYKDKLAELTDPYFKTVVPAEEEETKQAEDAAEKNEASGQEEAEIKTILTVKGAGNITFEIDGKLAIEDPDVLRAWEKWCFAERKGTVGKCLVTGKEGLLCESHPLVKGVFGAGNMGRLISIDKNTSSLNSYGHSGLSCAPINNDVSFRIHAALNWMLASEEYTQDTEKGTLVFWTRNNDIDLLQAIKSLFSEDVPAVKKVRDGEPFYMMELRGNGAGRIYVRNYRRFVTGTERFVQEFTDYLLSEVGINTFLNKLWEDEDMNDSSTPAPLLGKLFAQIQIAQMDAIPSTVKNGGIEKTYFTLATTRPDIAFTRLLNLLKIYLGKRDYGIGDDISVTLRMLEKFDPMYPSAFTTQEKALFEHSYFKHIAILKAERQARIEEWMKNNPKKNAKNGDEEESEEE